MTRYVILGNGVAGITAAEQIRKLDNEGEILVLTDEPHHFYSRIRLNEYLARTISRTQLTVKNQNWYENRRIQVNLGTRISDADAELKTVISKDGRRFSYDRLLVCTGSHSFIPPVKGVDLSGVFSIRTLDDVDQIIRFSRDTDDVIVIGGGLLGLEAGNALRLNGKNVTVVEYFPRLMPRQLDDQGAERLTRIMENMGFSFRFGVKTKEILGNGSVRGVQLDSGEQLTARMVIISAGVRPNLDLAVPLKLSTDKGIQINEYFQTSRPDVYAAGDAAEFQGKVYGIWPAAMEQGKLAGMNMAGNRVPYRGTTPVNTLKVAGIDLGSAGDIDADQRFESQIIADDQTYKKFVIRDNRLIGCIMLGDITHFNRIAAAMSENASISDVMKLL